MFKVNDVVLCIDDSAVEGYDKPEGITKGRHYHITGVGGCKCGTRVDVREVTIGPNQHLICLACYQDTAAFYAWRFIKLTGDDVAAEEETEKGLETHV